MFNFSDFDKNPSFYGYYFCTNYNLKKYDLEISINRYMNNKEKKTLLSIFNN